MEYSCVATSVECFVRQLAVAYITHGYWFYVTGTVPEGKDPATVDAKLIGRYDIAMSKWARCRRKKQGLANMQYLRHERFFVLLATKGRHEFFERERAAVRDVRRKSIEFRGYSIGCRKGRDGRWHSSVRFGRDAYNKLKARLCEFARRQDTDSVEQLLASRLFRQYGPVRRQVVQICRAVNEIRRAAGLAAVALDGRFLAQPPIEVE